VAGVETHQETDNLEKWERSGGVEGRLLRRFRKRLVAEAAALDPVSVLDAGCGEGVVSGWIAGALPHARVTGLEARAGALEEFARRHESEPRLEAAEGDLYAMPFEAGAFDLVVSTEVLEHLDSPGRALREMRRVGAGALLLTVPHEPFFRAGNLARGRYVRRLGSTPGHQSTWSRRGFTRLVAGETGGPVRWFSAFPWQGVVAGPRPPRS